jgi:hypothetical protein
VANSTRAPLAQVKECTFDDAKNSMEIETPFPEALPNSYFIHLLTLMM